MLLSQFGLKIHSVLVKIVLQTVRDHAPPHMLVVVHIHKMLLFIVVSFERGVSVLQKNAKEMSFLNGHFAVLFYSVTSHQLTLTHSL